MGIIVNKQQDRNTDLNDRIAADLRNRAQQSNVANAPDLAEDSDYVKHLKKTSKYGWIWFVLVLFVILALVLFTVF